MYSNLGQMVYDLQASALRPTSVAEHLTPFVLNLNGEQAGFRDLLKSVYRMAAERINPDLNGAGYRCVYTAAEAEADRFIAEQKDRYAREFAPNFVVEYDYRYANGEGRITGMRTIRAKEDVDALDVVQRHLSIYQEGGAWFEVDATTSRAPLANFSMTATPLLDWVAHKALV